ncbi:uncharacterized protein BDZ83DRAFT_121012 [Colletotrichum acutatum]|uniref:Uncharacterized protein n=1 Tax=Glomerella acutata TaxID=27357 RepID=A0AAD8UAC8_GLOAC|nr:uncharacterized protein BDZ83DRAFT_121012 [Colletotrichum acutatum]KAK1711220.1 hypothetical protein BDZ83DRAFT_121012 [Colletotrichum acutatum]
MSFSSSLSCPSPPPYSFPCAPISIPRHRGILPYLRWVIRRLSSPILAHSPFLTPSTPLYTPFHTAARPPPYLPSHPLLVFDLAQGTEPVRIPFICLPVCLAAIPCTSVGSPGYVEPIPIYKLHLHALRGTPAVFGGPSHSRCQPCSCCRCQPCHCSRLAGRFGLSSCEAFGLLFI